MRKRAFMGINSENYHFVNYLCAYQMYNHIPELFTFLSKLGNIEAIAVYSLAWSKT